MVTQTAEVVLDGTMGAHVKVKAVQVLLVLLGAGGVVANAAALIRQPLATQGLFSVIGLCLYALYVYVGACFGRLIITSPKRIEQLVWLGMAFTALNAIRALLRTLPRFGAAPLNYALYDLFMLGVFAVVFVIWFAVLRAVRHEAGIAKGVAQDA